MHLKELPRTRKVVTQDRSRVLRETEENPFEDEEVDEEEQPPTPVRRQNASTASTWDQSATISSKTLNSSMMTSNVKSKKVKKAQKKTKGFNLKDEKGEIKSSIAESSVASTNLLNALRLVNREKEQISENTAAMHHFESCKLLRRKILRYVRI